MTISNVDFKRLLGNFFSLAFLKFFNLILPLVTLPYLIRVLGFEKYGVIIIALSLKQYFQAFSDYGFNLSATRDIAVGRHSKKKLEYLYNKYLNTKLYLLVLVSAIYILLVTSVPFFNEWVDIYLYTLLMLVGHSLFPEWFYRGIEEMKYITFLDFIVKIAFTCGVFLFIKEEADYYLYPIIFGTGYILVSIFAHSLIVFKFNINFYLIDFKRVKRTLYTGFPLFLNQFLPNLYNSGTGIIIGLVLGNHSAGVFGAVRQVVNLLNVFNSVVTSVFFPYLSRNKSSFNTYSKYYLIFFTLVCFAFILITPLLFSFIGITEESANIIALFLTLGVYFLSIFSVFGTNYLVVNGREKVVMKIVGSSSVIGFFMSWVLVSSYGNIGGSINIFLCQLLMGTSALYIYHKSKAIS